MGCNFGCLLAFKKKLKNYSIYGDSKLIIQCLSGKQMIRFVRLHLLLNHILKTLPNFHPTNSHHISQKLNSMFCEQMHAITSLAATNNWVSQHNYNLKEFFIWPSLKRGQIFLKGDKFSFFCKGYISPTKCQNVNIF